MKVGEGWGDVEREQGQDYGNRTVLLEQSKIP